MQNGFGGLDYDRRSGFNLWLNLRLQLAAEDWTTRCHVDGLRDGFLFVGDAREPERYASALDQRFVSQHSTRVDLPRFRIAGAFREVFGHFDGMGPVFEMNRSSHAERLAVFVFGRELDTVETCVIVHHAYPSIDADNGLDAAIPRWECVDLAGKRVESVLVSGDDERQQLFVGRFGHQRSLQRLQQTGWLNAEFARHYRERGLLRTWNNLLFHWSSLAYLRAFHWCEMLGPLPMI